MSQNPHPRPLDSSDVLDRSKKGIQMFRRKRLVSPFEYRAYLAAYVITLVTNTLGINLILREVSFNSIAITAASMGFFFLTNKKLATSTTASKYAKHLKLFTPQLNPATIAKIKKQLTHIAKEDNTNRHFHYTFQPDHTPAEGEELHCLTRIAVDSEEGDSSTYVTTHFTACFSSKAKNT